MDGILLINKPIGITSRDVVNQLTKKFNTKKIGHTGTLDPDATGVLPVCLGKATKLCDMLTDKNKTYETPAILAKEGIEVYIITDHDVIPIEHLPLCAALTHKSST